MPVIPTGAAPYDTVNTVLNAARVRVNDAIASIGGDVLTNTQPFTQTITNLAWRRLQEFLANLGYSRVKSEAVIPTIPVVATSDPGVQAYLSWTGFWDGSSLYPSVVLPQDCIQPLKLWERPSGTNAQFKPMAMMLDGLPDCPKQGFNNVWEWRNDAIYLPGALVQTDIRIRYTAYLPDFATQGQTLWSSQPVPIARCLDAFASYIAAEFAMPRADLDAQSYITAAESAARKIFNREVQAKQRTTATRRPYTPRNSHNGFGFGY